MKETFIHTDNLIEWCKKIHIKYSEMILSDTTPIHTRDMVLLKDKLTILNHEYQTLNNKEKSLFAIHEFKNLYDVNMMDKTIILTIKNTITKNIYSVQYESNDLFEKMLAIINDQSLLSLDWVPQIDNSYPLFQTKIGIIVEQILFDEQYVPTKEDRINNLIYEIIIQTSHINNFQDMVVLKDSIKNRNIANYNKLYSMIEEKLYSLNKVSDESNKLSGRTGYGK